MDQRKTVFLVAMSSFVLGALIASSAIYSSSVLAAIVPAEGMQVGKVEDKANGVVCYYLASGISCVKVSTP